VFVARHPRITFDQANGAIEFIQEIAAETSLFVIPADRLIDFSFAPA